MKTCLLILSLGSLLVASGCTTTRLITPENAMKSRIEIDYVLGHSNYKYIALGGKEEAEISSFRDDKVLEKKSITASRYQDFAAKLEKAVRSSPAGVVDENCRTPYKIHIIIDDRESTMSGCRSADSEGQIGQLLKEGEFIFYTDETSKPSDGEQKEDIKKEDMKEDIKEEGSKETPTGP